MVFLPARFRGVRSWRTNPGHPSALTSLGDCAIVSIPPGARRENQAVAGEGIEGAHTTKSSSQVPVCICVLGPPKPEQVPRDGNRFCRPQAFGAPASRPCQPSWADAVISPWEDVGGCLPGDQYSLMCFFVFVSA